MRNKAEVYDVREIGSRIRDLRKERHMTQENLAEACHLSTSLIGHIERGEKSPSLSTIIQLSNIFHVSADTVLFGRAAALCDRSLCPLYTDLSRLIKKYDGNRGPV